MTAPTPRPNPKAALSPQRLLAPIAAVAAVLAVIAWVGFGSSGDRSLTAAEQLARTVAFNKAGHVVLQPVPDTERPAALQDMKLQPDQQAEIENRRIELVYLTLWDDLDEDGDQVAIESGGFSQAITLKNAPVTITIPRPPLGIINMTGVYDGGGGITVAVTSGAGQVPVPRLSVGQSIGVPVR